MRQRGSLVRRFEKPFQAAGEAQRAVFDLTRRQLSDWDVEEQQRQLRRRLSTKDRTSVAA
jgi:fibronectin type III domain protein